VFGEDAARTDEEGGQSEHKAIERGQIRGALSGAITAHELMLEQQRFRGDGADATRAEEFREGDKQMDRQEEQIAHESNILSPPANLRKTAPQGPFGLEFRNSPPTGSVPLEAAQILRQPR
jgi:hypothetical protein